MIICKKCGGGCKPSKALLNIMKSSNDFGDDAGQFGATRRPSGEAEMVDCLKCEKCGHSFFPNKKELLLNLINDSQGIKATELVVKFVTELYKYDLKLEDVHEFYTLLEELIGEKLIVIVSYSLKEMEYREKDFILPVGFDIQIRQ